MVQFNHLKIAKYVKNTEVDVTCFKNTVLTKLAISVSCAAEILLFCGQKRCVSDCRNQLKCLLKYWPLQMRLFQWPWLGRSHRRPTWIFLAEGILFPWRRVEVSSPFWWPLTCPRLAKTPQVVLTWKYGRKARIKSKTLEFLARPCYKGHIY